jgi:hypothetical protein
MYSPTITEAVARERQADMLRRAERERLGAEAGSVREGRVRGVRERILAHWRGRAARPGAAHPAV